MGGCSGLGGAHDVRQGLRVGRGGPHDVQELVRVRQVFRQERRGQA